MSLEVWSQANTLETKSPLAFDSATYTYTQVNSYKYDRVLIRPYFRTIGSLSVTVNSTTTTFIPTNQTFTISLGNNAGTTIIRVNSLYDGNYTYAVRDKTQPHP